MLVIPWLAVVVAKQWLALSEKKLLALLAMAAIAAQGL
jgi:hypothetical protein